MSAKTIPPFFDEPQARSLDHVLKYFDGFGSGENENPQEAAEPEKSTAHDDFRAALRTLLDQLFEILADPDLFQGERAGTDQRPDR